MPNIDLSILNQRQTPAFYADTLANRPAAGFVGRIFVSTDTFAFYRDNGTSWDLIGGPGTGTITGSGANGQVSYWNGASTITGSNDLFFDAVNGHLGIGTITPGTALDVKHDQSTVVQLEQVTATNDTRIAFINNGVGLWRIGSFYNAGANDFGLFDIAAATQPVTVKRTTGQVLIGTSTVGSGKLVVASATGDNGVQIVGASAPSLRIDNAESGPTKRAGFGISTATNNFIQGSADRDFCMFNGSTTASPILFGVYDAGAGNVQEAARISAARNFIVGKTTDTGQKLQISGTSNFSGTATFGTGSSTAIDGTDGRIITDKIRLYNVIPATNYSDFVSTATQNRTITIPDATGTIALTSNLSSYLLLSGGTMSGTLNLGTNTITAVGNLNSSTAQIGEDGLSQVLTLKGGSVSGNSNNVQLRFQGTKAAVDQWAIGNAVSSGDNTRNFDIYDLVRNANTLRIAGTTGNFLVNTSIDNGYKFRVNGNANVDGYISTSPSVNGIFCNINQHNTTVTLSSIFPNLTFTNTFISLNLQIIASSGSVTNATSFIYNCVRDYNGNWSSILVNSVGTVAVLTLTFAGTNAAPTLTITGVSFLTVNYNISILI